MVKRWVSRTLVSLVVGFGLFWLTIDHLLDRLVPRRDMTVAKGLPYRDGLRGLLDVYAPADGCGLPVVVFFYGGGWTRGRRELYEFVGKALATRGIVAIVADYRLYPEIRFPDFLRDAAAATSWARLHCSEFGGDPNRLFLMGHSAGAHMAAMLALDPQWLNVHSLDPQRDIAGFIGLSGPYDFGTLTRPELIDLFGGANRPEAKPIRFVTAGVPPAFLLSGQTDATVEPGNTSRMTARLREKGNDVRAVFYPGGHFRIILAFLRSLRGLGSAADDVADWIMGRTAKK
ncbi:alpha/beta hydrolase [Terrihabitans sp. B22-R8]|uniref:alpha/beta hydrolase n=1 Tax=Terrihabitans sp. B22-R8 TaxID=3425128 RepID=UPI00403C62CC